jgi:phospholipase D1/2
LEAGAALADPSVPLLQPGATCWRIERAGRFAQIVDAADYFAVLKAAMLQARHSIYLIGWDFDTRTQLEPAGARQPGPNRLGRLINWIVRRRPGLQVYILPWRLGLVRTLVRGTTAFFILKWIFHRRVHFQPDGHHPTGASHHQKIVVIDDAIAFCGGIDITGARWDTRAHEPGDRRRRLPGGRLYGAWHDATTAVDGAAARALGEFARDRWFRTTGKRLPQPPPGADPWPESLPVTLTDVDVAIARTAPAYGGEVEVREIEALYLAGIGAARRTVYLESQYLASRRIAEAIAGRLQEPEGPEIVVVNPESADGWLEEAAMGSARLRLLDVIRAADRYDRFRIYVPVTEAGEPIYVHAKIMIIDDRLLRIGSSNLNNRSMSFDTECDLAIEAHPESADRGRLQQAIRGIRDDLLAEHLGVTAEQFAAAHDGTGSLIDTIESLARPGRGLVPLKTPDHAAVLELLADADFTLPEKPRRYWALPSRKRRYLS